MANTLDLEQVKLEVHYDPETGVFTRLQKTNRTPAGAAATFGGRGDGYLRVSVCGRTVYAHRLAWFYMTGEWPHAHIDHRDRNPSNTRFANLREATCAQNNQNKMKPKGARSGYIGVSLHRKSGLWRARLNLGGKTMLNTYHKTAEEARDAYLAAKPVLHTFAVI